MGVNDIGTTEVAGSLAHIRKGVKDTLTACSVSGIALHKLTPWKSNNCSIKIQFCNHFTDGKTKAQRN